MVYSSIEIGNGVKLVEIMTEIRIFNELTEKDGIIQDGTQGQKLKNA